MRRRTRRFANWSRIDDPDSLPNQTRNAEPPSSATHHFLYLPTRYFFCHAGEPNFSLRDFRRPPDELALFARFDDRLFRLRRDALPERPPREFGNNAALLAGVIFANPTCPPGGTTQFIAMVLPH